MDSVLKLKKGMVIFWEGAQEEWMYDLVWGTVDIYDKYRQPGETKLATLKAGDFFGEMGLLEKAPRSATAVAASDCQLKTIKETDFAAYCQENPGKVLAVMQHTSRRLRELTEDYLYTGKLLSAYLKAEEAGEEISPELKKAMKQVAAGRRK